MGNIYTSVESSIEEVTKQTDSNTLIAAAVSTTVVLVGVSSYLLYNNNSNSTSNDNLNNNSNYRNDTIDDNESLVINGDNNNHSTNFNTREVEITIDDEDTTSILGLSIERNTLQMLYIYIVSILIFMAEIQAITVHNSFNPTLLPLFPPLFWTTIGLGIATNGIDPLRSKTQEGDDDDDEEENNIISNNETRVGTLTSSNNAEINKFTENTDNNNVVAVDLGGSNNVGTIENINNADDKELKNYELEDEMAKSGTRWSELLQILEKRLKNNESNQCQTLWRAARAAYNISEQPNISKEKKKEYIYISYNYMKMAMDNNGKESSKCNTWYGIMLNAIGAYEGIKIMVGNLITVKEFWQRANLLSKEDSSPPHLLGRWCKGILETSWWEKKAISGIFGGKMPQTSWEEALSYFEEAESRHNKLVQAGKDKFWITNTKCLAECLIKVERQGDAKSILLKSLEKDAISEEDKKSKLEIDDLLKSL